MPKGEALYPRKQNTDSTKSYHNNLLHGIVYHNLKPLQQWLIQLESVLSAIVLQYSWVLHQMARKKKLQKHSSWAIFLSTWGSSKSSFNRWKRIVCPVDPLKQFDWPLCFPDFLVAHFLVQSEVSGGGAVWLCSSSSPFKEDGFPWEPGEDCCGLIGQLATMWSMLWQKWHFLGWGGSLHSLAWWSRPPQL